MLNRSRWVTGCTLLCLAAAGRLPAEDTLRADQVLARAEERFGALRAYECQIDAASSLRARSEAGRYHLWYQAPGLLRVHVMQGRSAGADVVVDGEGKISGRRGGLLKPFVIRLKPTDPRLRSVRGVSLQDLTWGAFYRKFREHAGLPGAKTSVAMRPDPSQPYRVTVTYKEQAKQLREEYRIDASTWLMTEGTVFEDGVRVDHVTFLDVRINPDLPVGWFKL